MFFWFKSYRIPKPVKRCSVLLPAALHGGRHIRSRQWKTQPIGTSANTAVSCSLPTALHTGSTALMPAIFPIVLRVQLMKQHIILHDKDMFLREKQYLAAIAVAESMRKKKIINEQKLSRISRILLKKHRPIVSTLLLGEATYIYSHRTHAAVTLRKSI